MLNDKMALQHLQHTVHYCTLHCLCNKCDVAMHFRLCLNVFGSMKLCNSIHFKDLICAYSVLRKLNYSLIINIENEIECL